eukprot:366163-Rhodomonas_salina.2
MAGGQWKKLEELKAASQQVTLPMPLWPRYALSGTDLARFCTRLWMFSCALAMRCPVFGTDLGCAVLPGMREGHA